MDCATGTMICVVCLDNSSNNMKPLNELWKPGLTFSQLMCFLLDVNSWERLLSNICKPCEIRLVDSYLFKKQCLEPNKDYQKNATEDTTNDSNDENTSISENGQATEDPLSRQNKSEIKNSLFSSNSSEVKLRQESKAHKHSCLKCSLKFSTYREYQCHYRRCHRHKHVCSECGKLMTRDNLEKHQLSHSQPKHVCDICGRAFTLKENLTKHIRIHVQERRYECEYCGLKFVHWNSKRSHVVSQHTLEKKYECTVCQKKFSYSSNMLRHMRYHTGEMLHSCSFCSKKFNTSSELKNHIVSHTKQKEEICEICKKGFGTKKGLRSHMKTHTRERNYECPVCQKAFTQPHVLRTHLKFHPEHPAPPSRTVLIKKKLKSESQNSVVQIIPGDKHKDRYQERNSLNPDNN